jgi:ribonucleoside-triphosphate reductase (thioredoxin)
MDLGMSILSEATIHSKYARYLNKEQRREIYSEIIDRNKQMHIDKFPHLEREIEEAYELVYDKKVLPSMRSAQFAGAAIAQNQSRINNCAYLPCDNYRCFSETMFLLLGGTGVGYSVEHVNINQLPEVVKPALSQKYVIEDSIMGWAESIRMLFKAFFFGNALPQYDYSSIRQKGERLITSGGRAPGAAPLRAALISIKRLLNQSVGRQLTSLEVHSVMCIMADAVLAGGIRRAAMICFFDKDDIAMATCKHGNWWETKPYLGRSNNSMVAYRDSFTIEDFKRYFQWLKDSRSGEPGLYWTTSKTARSNPCVEAKLIPFSFCNLSTINASIIYSQKEYNKAASVASFLGTLQASYTDFHYLRSCWKTETEKDALIGVSSTGIASETFLKLNHTEAANIVVETNKYWAKQIGINQAARCTLQKPDGTTSIAVGSSSGVHAWHDKWYIRRIRVGKHEAIYKYFSENLIEFLEDDFEKPHLQAILAIPCCAPENAITRNESALSLLERVKKFYQEWVTPGHNRGEDTHSISVTVSVKDNEWDDVFDWMWNNKNSYAGISVLPFDGGTYIQAPFESISEEKYYELFNKLPTNLNFTEVIELDDNTNLQGEASCAGGACLI